MNVETQNPLLSRAPLPISNWGEWLTRWEGVISLQEMLGLLHFGFEVEMYSRERNYTWKDRILFYLSIADGWTDDWHMYTEEDREKRGRDQECAYSVRPTNNDNRVRKTIPQLRREVATKAASLVFKQLIQITVEVSGRCRPEPNPEWESIFTDDFFPFLRHFFRITERTEFSNPEVMNLTTGSAINSHVQRFMIQFLTNLAQAMWGWQEPSYYSTDERRERAEALRARIEDAKPWMVEVLCRCRESAMLEKWLLNLDGKCLEVLASVALEKDLLRDGRAETVEAACYDGSPLAWLLIRHRVLSEETKRRQGITETNQREQEARGRRAAEARAKAEIVAAQEKLAALQKDRPVSS